MKTARFGFFGKIDLFFSPVRNDLCRKTLYQQGEREPYPREGMCWCRLTLLLFMPLGFSGVRAEVVARREHARLGR